VHHLVLLPALQGVRQLRVMMHGVWLMLTGSTRGWWVWCGVWAARGARHSLPGTPTCASLQAW
jgi:hypothetical protein